MKPALVQPLYLETSLYVQPPARIPFVQQHVQFDIVSSKNIHHKNYNVSVQPALAQPPYVESSVITVQSNNMFQHVPPTCETRSCATSYDEPSANIV